MYPLINFFLELCLLRRAPQDLPASGALLAVVFGVDLLVGLGGALKMGGGYGIGVAETLFMLLLLYAALRQVGRPKRFVQTATALLGIDASIGLIVLLAIMPLDMTDPPAFAAITLLGVLVWKVLIAGHILRHAFEIDLTEGFIVSTLYTILALEFIATVSPAN